MTNKGLRIEIDLTAGKPPVAILECYYDNDLSGLLGIPLIATGIPSVYMSAPGELALYRPSHARLKIIYIVKNHPLKATGSSYKTCMLNTELMSNYGFHIADVAPSQFPFNWKSQTLKMLQGSGREMAAFKFCNSQWDHEPVVLFALTSSGDKGFLKIVDTQGGEPLQDLLEKELKTAELFSRHSMTISPPRNSTNQNTTLTINASVKKEIIFRREIFVLNVGISE